MTFSKKRRSSNHTRRKERKRKTKNKRKMVGGMTEEQQLLHQLELYYGPRSALRPLLTKPKFVGVYHQLLTDTKGNYRIVDLLTAAIQHTNEGLESHPSERQNKKGEWLNIILKYMQDNKEINVDIPDREATRSTLSDAIEIIEKAKKYDFNYHVDRVVYDDIISKINLMLDRI